jgi:hypothetical protein
MIQIQDPAVAQGSATVWWIAAALLAVAALLLFFFWRKGRRLPGEHVFRASRLSRGNWMYPTQVVVTPSSVLHYKPEMVGGREQTIHIAHISSVLIDRNLFFSDVLIETSGGHNPVRCHGHRKRDAVAIKQIIERYQTDYYARPGAHPGEAGGRPEKRGGA